MVECRLAVVPHHRLIDPSLRIVPKKTPLKART